MRCDRKFILSLAVAVLILFPAMGTASGADKPMHSAWSLVSRPEGKVADQEDETYQEEKIRPIKPFVLMELGIASLKNEGADRMKTSSSGFMFGLGGGLVFYKFFDIGAGLGVLFFKGETSSADLTTGDENAGSFAPFFYYAQAGVQVPIPFKNKKGLFPLWIGVHEGILGVPAGREIATGVDDGMEQRRFRSRNYFQAEIKIQVAPEIFVGAAYTIFCRCSDFRNRFVLSLSGNLISVFRN